MSYTTTTVRRVKKLTALPVQDVDELMQDTRWADGLRGIASLFVVSSHLTLCFARRIVTPCCGPDSETPLLWQYPPFRLVGMGHSWVALFIILLGFVNALKPLKLARQQRTEQALANLAQSSFRRTFRLMLPATAATVISWFLCQLGFYTAAHRGDAFWTLTNTAWPSDSWRAAVGDLVQALRHTWMFFIDNTYDQPQWALIYLLYGSMVVFMSLLMTVNLTARWRVSAMLVFTWWSLDWTRLVQDPLVPACVYAGMMLSELSLSSIPRRLASISHIASPLLVAGGLFVMSHPSEFSDKAGWTRMLQQIGLTYFPTSAQFQIERVWGSIGGSMLVLAVLISPALRRLLAAPPLTWLGKVSFPIYLLHSIFIQTVLAWLAFKPEPQEFETDRGPELRYPQRGPLGIWLAIAVSMGLMLVACHYWTIYVEPVFAKITLRLEKVMTGKTEDAARNGGYAILPVKKNWDA